MPEGKLITIRVPEAQLLEWDRLVFMTAHRNRSKWIREIVSASLGPSPFSIPQAPAVDHSHAKQIAKDLHDKAKSHSKSDSATKGTCDNRVPKGAYCKRCGQTHD